MRGLLAVTGMRHHRDMFLDITLRSACDSCPDFRSDGSTPKKYQSSKIVNIYKPYFAFMDDVTFGLCDPPSSAQFKFVKENFISMSILIARRQ